MTEIGTPVEYRQESGVPSEPGWYWACVGLAGKIEPVFLAPSGRVEEAGDWITYQKDQYRWFGPLIQVKEG